MDALVKQVAERVVHHALSLDTRLAGKCGTFDLEREVTFPFGIISAVPAMLLAVVDELDAAGRKRRMEPEGSEGSDPQGEELVGWSVAVRAFRTLGALGSFRADRGKGASPS